MIVLGISGLDHSVPFKRRVMPGLDEREYRIVQGLDAAAALVSEDGVLAAAAEERFSGDKGTGAFPIRAIQACLETSNLTLDDIDAVAHGFSYEAFASELQTAAMEPGQFDAVYSRAAVERCLDRWFPGSGLSGRLVRVPHHLAHAASAYYSSGFDEALIFVADGMGEVDSSTVAVGRNGSIEVLRRTAALHSLGILYGIGTLYLGFLMGMDEYKVMGLAPLGDPRRFHPELERHVNFTATGEVTIPLLARDRTVLERETHGGVLKALEALFGPRREPEAPIEQRHMDFAAALQAVLQNALLHQLTHLRESTALDRLCMAGGVALNCSANGVIKRSGLFSDMFVQPAAGDDGTSVGAALMVLHQRSGRLRPRKMRLPLWGPAFDAGRIERALRSRSLTRYRRLEDEVLCDEAARLLADGAILGWFQGRMEFGPRALGSRSILADPRRPDMRVRINALVKKREEFRPFAPAVKQEAAARYFEIADGDTSLFEYMLCVTHVRDEFRDALPATTHVDGSARAQTVDRATNPLFWNLLDAFERVSGFPIVLNTSFNVRGQPIVCTPEEAVDTFVRAGLTALVIGPFLVESDGDAAGSSPA
ncbi:MAG: carbamoyltransferase [Candidatus Latescibacteria bacterium]|nr:carbamoyltransferase [Candidatus Latescibacterota bacterium]